MSDTVIKVENLGKKYIIGHQKQEKYTALRDVVANGVKKTVQKLINSQSIASNAREEFWALKDVSFEIKQGDRVGIIGRNGAGKSTLLKVLSRITEPTEGRIQIKGRVTSLLEVGTGFHPELTGRENIFLNGAILGMSKVAIKKKFDEIVAFAEIEKFLDTPVKRYSSGMYVRLAFAVAAHLEPEILVVDEVLAVGDAAFQKKCLGKMEDVGKEGRTIIFVSHNMSAIENLCKHSVVLESGKIKKIGLTTDCISFYLNTFNKILEIDLSERKDRKGSGKIKITDIFFETSGVVSDVVRTGDQCNICFKYIAQERYNNVSLAFTIRDERSQFLFRPSSEDTKDDFSAIPIQGFIRCKIKKLPLVPGQYRITTRLTVNKEESDYVEGAAFLIVEPGDYFGTGRMNTHSPVLLEHNWEIN